MEAVRPAQLARAVLLMSAALGCCGQSAAQSYPSRPIRMLVPFAPGGGVDFIGRLVAVRFAESMGQPVVIDNRAGAGGVIASETAARAAPDGHTLVMANNSTHGVNQALNPKLPYDTVKDFSFISLLGSAPHLLVTPVSFPPRNVKELIALAKAKPGQINFGSAGIGSQTHLSGELFKYTTGTNLVHVPYSGTGPGFTALLAGEIQVLFASTPGSMPHVQAGRLKALAISGEKRSQLLPNMPTLAEQGVSGFETGPWYALLGPARLPKTIISKLNEEIVKVARSTDFREKLAAQGAEPVGSTPEECARVIANELAKWTKVVKEAGVRLE